jgi:signal transduction histidine kinase
MMPAGPGSSSVAELRQRVAELTVAAAARDTFITVAAHELRNPLVPIVGQIDLLLSAVRSGRCPPERVEQWLELIQHTMRHFLRRAGVLLDVSRIASGGRQLSPEPFDLVALLTEIVTDHAAAAHHAGTTITVRVPASLPGTWDRLAVEQIADNLVSNAIKYGAATPVELDAASRGEHVVIRVRDYGGGISAADRERVFGRFAQAVGQGKRRNGFGVGLWLVRQLAEAMGGAVDIESASGGGALFIVVLPRHVKEMDT